MALIVAPPVLAALVFGAPAHFRPAQLKGFNFVGGLRLTPEFVALVLGLSTYTASFIAEIVRAGLLAVPKWATRGGRSIGADAGAKLRLIVAPQAMRVIAPPLTSQYLNSHQELLVGRVHLLSRPRAGVHGHGAEPDRSGGADRGADHGGLSRHLAGGLRCDERL